MQSLLEKVDSRNRTLISAAEATGRTRTVGIAWYHRDDYPEIQRLMTDADVLPADYDSWLRLAQQVATAEEAMGSAIVKATIVPQAFREWCLATKQQPDVHARTRHVNEAVEDYCRRR